MKFRDGVINPGVIVHCPTEGDAIELLRYLKSRGNIWWDNGMTLDNPGKLRELHQFYEEGRYLCIKVYTNKYDLSNTCEMISKIPTEEITEFSDLIEADENLDNQRDNEMSAVEVLEKLKEYNHKCKLLDVFDIGNLEVILVTLTIQEIIDKITAYEAAKKAPKPVEVEWVDVCRIIQIQDNGIKKCVYEEVLKPETPFDTDPDLKEQAEAILKKYISEHKGQYIAVVEGICRVKEDK